MAPQLSRMKSSNHTLRDLDRNNILTPTPTQQTIEIDGDSETTSQRAGHKYGTRTAKYGRAAETYDKYDMKYHPADEKLRPAQALKRRSASGSGSRSLSISTPSNEDDDDGGETDEESLPTFARDDGSDEAPNEDSEDATNVSERTPDPRASRSSKRSQAQKYVNYSTKHHKDDHSIPGFQHKSRQPKRSAASDVDGGGVKKKCKAVKAGKHQSHDVQPDSHESIDVDDLVEQTLLAVNKMAPSTSRSYTVPSAQAIVVSSGEQRTSNAVDSDDARLEEHPVPAFTILDGDADNEHSRFEAQMPILHRAYEDSQDIDEELLNFTQIPTSDREDGPGMAALEQAISGSDGTSSVDVEADKVDFHEPENDSSSEVQQSSGASQEGGQEVDTSYSSYGRVSMYIEPEPDELPANTEEPKSVAEIQQVAHTIAQDTMESTDMEYGHSIEMSGFETIATAGCENKPVAQPEGASTRSDSALAGAGETQKTKQTLEDDVSTNGTVAAEVGSVSSGAQEEVVIEASGGIQVQGTEQASVSGNEDHGSEPVEVSATTLQAILEHHIAASQCAIVDSSSSDMLI